jgi:hypothetical protein
MVSSISLDVKWPNWKVNETKSFSNKKVFFPVRLVSA